MGEDADQLVDAGESCRRCGYDLRLLPVNGCCPECGHSARDSLQWARRRRTRWSWVDYATLAVLSTCAAVLLGHAASLGRPIADYQILRGANLLGGFCCCYLCARFRPVGRQPGRHVAWHLPLLAVLTLLCALLYFAADLECALIGRPLYWDGLDAVVPRFSW